MAIKLSFGDKQTALRQAIRTKLGIPDDSMKGPWLRDTWDDEVVYEFGNDTYKMSYSFDDQGKPTLGDPAKVRMQTTYVTERLYVHESVEIPLQEATTDKISKGILPIRIIQPGFNTSKTRHYSKEAVADTVKIFEGAKQFANHASKSEEKDRPERDIRDWVATLENVRVSPDGSAVGDAHIHAGWFKDMVDGLRAAGTLNKLGVSINAIGRGVKKTIEGVETFAVESLIDHPFKSVDFVTEAGAGGQAGIQESAKPETDVYLINLTKFKEARPDLVVEISNEVKNTEVNKLMDLEKEVKTLKESVDALTKERDDLKAKIAESERATKKAEAQVKIREAVNKSTLPEAAKAKLVDQFKEAETADGIDAAIKAESDYLAKLAEVGKVKGLGAVPLADPKKSYEALVESFKGLGMSQEQAETAARGR